MQLTLHWNALNFCPPVLRVGDRELETQRGVEQFPYIPDPSIRGSHKEKKIIFTKAVEELFDRISMCDWFTNCGSRYDGAVRVIGVGGWTETVALAEMDSDGCWTDVMNKSMNRTSMAAFAMDQMRYQEIWSDIARDVQSRFEKAGVLHRLQNKCNELKLPLKVFRICRGMLGLSLQPRIFDSNLRDTLIDDCMENFLLDTSPAGTKVIFRKELC